MTNAAQRPRRGIAAALALLAGGVAAQNSQQEWPQYGGPTRNGAVEYALGDRPTLVEAWRRPLPSGASGITAAGERLFTLASDDGDDLVFAFDQATGKELWRTSIGNTHGDASNGPASTPAAVGGLVIGIGSSCRIQAMRAGDGTIVWQRSLTDDYKSRFAARGGCGMSPLVSGSLIVVPTGAQDGARLVALEATTGKQAWAAADLPSSLNGAPGIARTGGDSQILYHHAKPPGLSGVSAVRADDGSTVWQADSPEGMSDTMPLPLPGNRVLLQTWMNSTLFDASAGPRVVWTTTELSAAGPPPVYRDGHLYGFGGNSAEFLKCIETASGKVTWSSRTYRGGVLLAGRTLVMLSESAGLLRLIDADPAAFRERARLQVLTPGAWTLTPPSFAGGRVFVRNLEEMVAVSVR